MDSMAAARYSRALFNLAEEQKILPQAEKDLARVYEYVRQYPEISHLVLNSTISYAEKEDFIIKVFPSDTAGLVLDFLKVLIKKGRFKELASMQKAFHRLYEKKLGVQEVLAITAIPMAPNTQEKLRQTLKHKFQREIRLALETDTGILGGMILRFDGLEIDGSFKGRLHEIRQILMA